MKRIKKILIYIFAAALPIIAPAQTTSPPRGGGGIWNNGVCEGDQCGFGNFILLLQDVISFLLIIAIPISAIVFAVGGFKIMTSGDNAGARTDAKKMMMKVAIGLVFMLAAGLIVNTILSGLGVSDEYKLIETTP